MLPFVYTNAADMATIAYNMRTKERFRVFFHWPFIQIVGTNPGYHQCPETRKVVHEIMDRLATHRKGGIHLAGFGTDTRTGWAWCIQCTLLGHWHGLLQGKPDEIGFSEDVLRGAAAKLYEEFAPLITRLRPASLMPGNQDLPIVGPDAV